MKACLSQSTHISDAKTKNTGVMSVSRVVIAGNNGTNEDGNIEKGDGGEPDNSIRLRIVITDKNNAN